MKIVMLLAALLVAGVSLGHVELRVAAASDLRFALDTIAKRYAAEHPGVTITPVYEASGALTAQIERGAPFDLFFSADTRYAQALVASGQTEGNEFAYAQGHLVLWTTNGSRLDLSRGLEVLKDPAVKKIALANPRTAPYGRAAEAALKKAGVYDAVSAKLVYGNNVAQTAQFVQAGAADVALIALSLAKSERLVREGRYAALDGSLHPPIRQAGVVVKSSRHLKAAKAFGEYMTSPVARRTLGEFGFSTP